MSVRKRVAAERGHVCFTAGYPAAEGGQVATSCVYIVGSIRASVSNLQPIGLEFDMLADVFKRMGLCVFLQEDYLLF